MMDVSDLLSDNFMFAGSVVRGGGGGGVLVRWFMFQFYQQRV
jgi:hypothetical protein